MKTVCKKLLCLMLVAMLLVSAVPAAFAATYYKLNVQLVIDGQVVATETLSSVEEGASASMSSKMVKMNAEGFWSDYFNQYEFVSAESVSVESMSADVTVKVVLKSKECAHANKTTTVNNATCGEAGSETVTCDDCSTMISTAAIPATGNHNYANGVCSVCGAKDPNYVEVAGDLIVYVMTRTYNETDDSYTEYADANGGKAIVVSGAANNSLTEALAESIVGQQLLAYKWQGGDVDSNGNKTVNLLATILETSNGQKVYQLRVYTNDGTSNYKQIDIYEGEGILAAIKNAGITPKYEDHVLVGYSIKMTGNVNNSLNIYSVASASIANSADVIKVFADWREVTDDDDEDYEYGEGGGLYGDDNDDPIYDVVLYVYTNGKTSSYAKKITASSMGKYTKDGILTRDEVQLVVENYFKTTSDTKYYGLFNKYYWNSGNYLTENAEYQFELNPNETNYVYVMVKNATAYVADSSNPKTGDNIMIAVTTMTLAAAALVSMVELKKRKMI